MIIIENVWLCAYGACLFVNVCFCARKFLSVSVLGDCKLREQSVSKQNISKEYEIFYCNSSHRTQTNNNRSHHHNDWVWRIQNKRMSKVNNETKAMKWSTRNERREQTKEKQNTTNQPLYILSIAFTTLHDDDDDMSCDPYSIQKKIVFLSFASSVCVCL